MQTISYLKVAKGRWKTIVALGLIGVALGFAVTAASGKPAAPPAPVYSATHTLVIEAGESTARVDNRAAAQTLSSAALLVTVGQVPQNAANALGLEVERVTSAVTTTTNADVGVLQITTTLGDEALAAEVSNTLARELIVFLAAEARQQYEAELAAAEADVTDLRSQLDKLPPLPPVVAGTQPDQVKNVPREALGSQFQTAAAELYRLSGLGTPTAGLVTLQEAEPVRIDPAELARQQQQASRGQTRATGSGSPAVTTPVAAEPPQPAGRTDKKLVMAISGLMGLLCGAGLALLAERLAPRVRTRTDAEAGSGLPVIAEIPRISRKHRRRPQIALAAEPLGIEADAYRHLRSSVLCASSTGLLVPAGDPLLHISGNGHTNGTSLSVGGEPLPVADPPRRWSDNQASQPSPVATPTGLKVSSRDVLRQTQPLPTIRHELGAILVTSPAAGDGKTSTVVNLAAVLGEAGKSVVVLDLDLRQSKMHRFVPEPAGPGLTQLLRAGEDEAVAELRRVQRDSGVHYFLSGAPAENPSELLPLERTLVGEARDTADLVLIDAPPLLATSDAAELSPAVDAVVLVFRAGSTTMEAANRASEKLARLGTSVLGVVLMEAPILGASRSYHPARRRPWRRRADKPNAKAKAPATKSAGKRKSKKPASTLPDTRKPESAAKPDSTKPNSTKPDSTKPDTSRSPSAVLTKGRKR